MRAGPSGSCRRPAVGLAVLTAGYGCACHAEAPGVSVGAYVGGSQQETQSLSGWYEAETGLDNSTLLAPLEGGQSDYVMINHARGDGSLPVFMARQLPKRNLPQLHAGQSERPPPRRHARPVPSRLTRRSMPGRRVPHIRHTGHRTPNTTDWSMKTRASDH